VVVAQRWAGAAFLGVGAASAALYALWSVWVPLLPTNLFVPLLDLGKMTGYRWDSALRYLALEGGLFSLYGVGYALARRGAASLTQVLLLAALFCAPLLLVYPATAADLFGYVAQGRLLALHHVNPFSVVPDDFPGDAILPYVVFPREPSQYGPLWAWIGATISLLAGADARTVAALPREALLYKTVAAVAHLGGAALVFSVARRLADRRSDAVSAAYLFAWNPLLLWEMVGNAHNDGVMALGGLGALLAFASRRGVWVLPAVALGAMVKVPIVAAAPVLAIVLWRRGARATLVGLGSAAALVAAAYAPFWHGLATLTFLGRGDLFTASPASALRYLLTPARGEADAAHLARLVTGALLLAVLAPILYRALRARSEREAVELTYWAVLAALLLGVTWFQAWYLAWPLAMAAPLALPARNREVVLLSVGGMGTYLVFIYLWVMGVIPGGATGAQIAAVSVLLGPLLLGWVIAALPRPRAREPWSLTSAAR